jgi:hypothetical protein
LLLEIEARSAQGQVLSVLWLSLPFSVLADFSLVPSDFVLAIAR